MRKTVSSKVVKYDKSAWSLVFECPAETKASSERNGFWTPNHDAAGAATDFFAAFEAVERLHGWKVTFDEKTGLLELWGQWDVAEGWPSKALAVLNRLSEYCEGDRHLDYDQMANAKRCLDRLAS